MSLTKKDFKAGSPYCSWLKEELTGAIQDYPGNAAGRALIKKHNVRVNKDTERNIMRMLEFDNLPKDLKSMATDIIRTNLDSKFNPDK